MIFLELALYEKLVADAELVSLVGHSGSNISIFAGYPDAIAKYPCLAFWYETSKNDTPAIDEVQDTIVNFGIFVGADDSATYNSWATKGRLLCERIADRLQTILQPGNQADLSLTNSQVRSLAVLFLSRLPLRYQIENTVYRIDISVQITWHNK